MVVGLMGCPPYANLIIIFMEHYVWVSGEHLFGIYRCQLFEYPILVNLFTHIDKSFPILEIRITDVGNIISQYL